ncbi:MAG TPA: type I-C CRISPR-associated protein Cas8c/Csd1 [Streptosporangiaceae bacterium]|nr:type I-C CRISPR-associated protein Cas8c/Csd1 [Streptosporangiaceae bacterium]
MLLTRLVEYADNGLSLPPPFYARQRVRWVLELNPDGSPASDQLTDLADGDGGRRGGVEHEIPSIVRTVAIAPKIGVDTGEYVFGWVTGETKQDRVHAAHTAFRELNDQWVARDPDGPACVLQAFFAHGHADRFRPPDGHVRGELIAVKLKDGMFLHATESAQRFWLTVAGGRKALGIRGLCLVCGKVDELLKTVPQQLPTRLVPQATQRASLVSINKASHGFALREQLVHTPICVRCGLVGMAALEQLLADQWQSAIAGQDTRLVWWVTGKVEFSLEVLDQPTPHRVAQLVGSAARGRQAATLSEADFGAFCAVAIGGNVSRAMVREWIDVPLRTIHDNLREWFTDHEIVDAWSGEPKHVGVNTLAYVSGRWIPGSGRDKGAYAKFGASGADRPDGVHRALLRSALLGKPLPPKLLAHIVRRVRTDGRLGTERAALIRLALRRRPGLPDREVYLPILNPDNHQPAYLAGRIFAVLEDIQLSAAWADGDEPPNVTFADRYFARAVTSPAVALVAGRRDAQAWLKRLKRRRPKTAEKARQRLDELVSQLNQHGGMPQGVILADQASFILGYHQQWAAMRAERPRRPGSDQHTPHEEGVSA